MECLAESLMPWSSSTKGKVYSLRMYGVIDDLVLDRDMHARISLWHSLTRFGWPYPQRDPLSKAELVEEERLRRAILEARKLATEEELRTPCRSLRLLVGMKGS